MAAGPTTKAEIPRRMVSLARGLGKGTLLGRGRLMGKRFPKWERIKRRDLRQSSSLGPFAAHLG
jgi:hypothetical protein